ncbi:hypothetical protein ABI59_23885 [Acidobacteria bacterium Mor1]|nr:hypothetical protein ABI59_23885 [Acidobacteria bacterium Mor1]
MSECCDIQPLLSRLAESEADPSEAMRVARHLEGCTACRILLARERRLGDFLENGLQDSISVDEDFCRSVMARLPETAPEKPSKKARRRGLKLAMLGGVALMLSPVPAASLPRIGAALDLSAPMGLDSKQALQPGFEALTGLGALALEALRGGPTFDPTPFVAGALPLIAGVVMSLALGVFGGSTLAALAAGRAVRSR